MSDYQRETAFLRECILHDDTGERHKLEEKLAQLQQNQRCVRRAAWLMALLAALATAALCYAAVFLTDYPPHSRFATGFAIKVLCVLAVGSLICLLAFLGLGAVYRKGLDQRREECRRLVTKLLEAPPADPSATALPGAMTDRTVG